MTNDGNISDRINEMSDAQLFGTLALSAGADVEAASLVWDAIAHLTDDRDLFRLTVQERVREHAEGRFSSLGWDTDGWAAKRNLDLRAVCDLFTAHGVLWGDEERAKAELFATLALIANGGDNQKARAIRELLGWPQDGLAVVRGAAGYACRRPWEDNREHAWFHAVWAERNGGPKAGAS